jgi:hypothetical protein
MVTVLPPNQALQEELNRKNIKSEGKTLTLYEENDIILCRIHHKKF